MPADDYHLWHLKPKVGTFDFEFADWEDHHDPWDRGSLMIEDQFLTIRLPIPDSLDHIKLGEFNFSWGHPIFLRETFFHCQLLVKTRCPKDGVYLAPRRATKDEAGGIDFFTGDNVLIGRACHSEAPTGRGRVERVLAMCGERGKVEIYSKASMKQRVLQGLSFFRYSDWLAMNPSLRELDAYVTAYPSPDSA